MVTLADARNNSAKPGSVGGDLLVLLSGAAYAVCNPSVPSPLAQSYLFAAQYLLKSSLRITSC